MQVPPGLKFIPIGLLMRLFSRDKPKIKVETSKKDGFSGWLKCSHCSELVHVNELKKRINTCPNCEYHYRLSAVERVKLLADPDSFKEFLPDLVSTDPLFFKDSSSYQDRLNKAKDKASREEAILSGTCCINSKPVCLAILDFNFMGGSMGIVVGERLANCIEYAIENYLPVIVVSASGGARMQESTLSLMQMAKVSAALAKLHEAGLAYISVLTNPSTGGVMASFASLGDLIIAEPNALIAFTGPRVIEQTIGQKLPQGAQKSEFLLQHGMIDAIVPRQAMKAKLSDYLEFCTISEYKLAKGAFTLGDLKGFKHKGSFPQRLRELMNMSEEKYDEEKNSSNS